MTERINPACEYAAIAGVRGGGTPPNLGMLPGSPERAMREVDVDPATEQFCGADRCSLELQHIIDWSVASTYGNPDEAVHAERIRRCAGAGCYVLQLLDKFQFPPNENPQQAS